MTEKVLDREATTKLVTSLTYLGAGEAAIKDLQGRIDFVGPIMPVQIEVLNNLAEKARGDYAILPQEGSVTRVQFN